MRAYLGGARLPLYLLGGELAEPSCKPNAALRATPDVLGIALALHFVIEVHEEAERPKATDLGPQNVPASRAGNHHIDSQPHWRPGVMHRMAQSGYTL